MNSHFIAHLHSEEFMDVMRSIELFVAIIFVASLVGFVCVSIA